MTDICLMFLTFRKRKGNKRNGNIECHEQQDCSLKMSRNSYCVQVRKNDMSGLLGGKHMLYIKLSP